MMAQIKPLGDRVVVRATQRAETTRSGIVLPDTAKEKPQEGQIVAVGPGRMGDDGKRIPVDLHEGDKVIYARYAGSEIKLEDEEYLILGEKDVLAVLSR
jgi:chaperonin GroES